MTENIENSVHDNGHLLVTGDSSGRGKGPEYYQKIAERKRQEFVTLQEAVNVVHALHEVSNEQRRVAARERELVLKGRRLGVSWDRLAKSLGNVTTRGLSKRYEADSR